MSTHAIVCKMRTISGPRQEKIYIFIGNRSWVTPYSVIVAPNVVCFTHVKSPSYEMNNLYLDRQL